MNKQSVTVNKSIESTQSSKTSVNHAQVVSLITLANPPTETNSLEQIVLVDGIDANTGKPEVHRVLL